MGAILPSERFLAALRHRISLSKTQSRPGVAVAEQPAVRTFLFTDIEGSTRLWEEEPDRMQRALVRHDQILREAVERLRGIVVKTTGDGVHAVFQDPHDAVAASVEAQIALADYASTEGLALHVRCGMHAGVSERSEDDYFGSVVNRAARIMSAANGGQVLVSQTVADLIRDRLPSGVSLRDLGAVRLRGLSGVEHLYQVEHAKLRCDFPALRSLEGMPNNLPLQLTTFVGREREQREIRVALTATRLLTLSGVGGLGKTRLSLQVAAIVGLDYPDGVWFVELAPLNDATFVPQAVASVLGVKEEPGRPVREALIAFVRDRRLLLILDNCEHVIRACAELAKQLLQAGAHVKILASSREHFNLRGERVYTLSPLSIPDHEGTRAVDAMLGFEAVRLFVERAMAVQPAFSLSEHNVPAVVEICRRLDGIPLALELAAARVSALSVEQIAARVNDRFRLLTTGDRTAVRRQQTLRSAIDWSYDLLAESERILFRRLAVFAGGWTLEAAEAVAAGGSVSGQDILDLLGELVDKSLVVISSEGARYRLLETVRQYAEERLTETAEDEETRRRHLDFYLAFVEKAGAGLIGEDQSTWLEQLDADRENVLSAHAWCLRTRDGAETGYRLVHAIKLYWFIRGLLDLGHRVTIEALSNPPLRPHSLLRCKALWVAGQICSYTGRYAEAQRHLQESLAIALHHDDRSMIASVHTYLALAALGQGDRAAARVHSEQALELARESGNQREITVASNALAQLNRLDGNLDLAEPLYEQVVALAHDLHDQEFAAIGILGLAMVAIGRGLTQRASDLLRQALAIAEATGSQPAAQSALETSAGLAAYSTEWERSVRLYGAAEAQTLRTGIRRDPADDAFLQPLLAEAREALGESRFTAIEASGRAMSFEEAIAEVRMWLAARN
jgi:predicted ATPase/class 3 adenylate cyclase